MHTRLLASCSLILSLAGCVAPISVHEGDAKRPPAIIASQQTLDQASKTGKHATESISSTLDALRQVSRSLGSGNKEAIPEYNFLTARLIEQLIAADLRPWRQAATLDAGQTRQHLRGSEPAELVNEQRNLVMTDRLHFTGQYDVGSCICEGIGAPLISISTAKVMNPQQLPYRALTAVVRFEGNDAIVDLVDPFRTTQVSIAGKALPLHADFGSNIRYLLSRERIDQLGLARLLQPSRYDDTARLAPIQPYDPDRIPVLFVHGLQDTPASFAPLYFELMSDPVIRERFQFWAFSYPSGYPYPMPAAILRKELDRMKRTHPGHKDIVIIGHSMGGLISRLMVTDVGDAIWRDTFGTPPSETKLSGYSRKLLEDALVFNSRDDIARAIFIAAPHRGSELASNFVGRIAVKLVRFPDTLANVRNTMVTTVSLDGAGFELDRFPSSIDTLSPSNRFVKRINTFPIESSIPFHSIMGDRGIGNTPNSSDGVVAYWSSHLDGAVSEKIVPSGHTAHQNPEGIEEVRRILCLHAGISYKAKRATTLAPEEDRQHDFGPRHKSR